MNTINIIGNTPMIKINYRYNGNIKHIYVKLEYYNLTGSIKDRVALYIVNNAQKRGILKKDMPIIEATSGNTGISLSAIGAYYNYPVYIFMPNWASKERINLMKSYKANVTLISREEGGFLRCVQEAKRLAKIKSGFLANQFANKDNYQAHFETTGEEIINQLPEEVGGFVSGVGTGGTLMGVGDKIKTKFKNAVVTAIEPDKMPIISTGKMISQHKIEGIGDDFVPDLVDKEKIDKIYLVNDDDAINMSRRLSRELGLGVGISSGANLIGSILLNGYTKKPSVTVFADDNKKYLSTDLSKEIDYNKNFISNQIKLINYELV
ncbi:MAG: cysteine synthase family protein [Clostridia bacterium]|jgi:cysteine synthase A|nr:cysteine synthase family protein [Clostridia bacterium]